MDGALQRWDRIALVHFQRCSDLVGEAVSGGRVKYGKGVCDFQVTIKVLPIFEILWFREALSALQYLASGHLGDPLCPFSLRLHTGLQFRIGQGWEQEGLLLGRTNFNAQPWYTTNAGSPRLIRGAISISTVLIGLSKEGSQTWISMMQCNCSKGLPNTLCFLDKTSLEAW